MINVNSEIGELQAVLLHEPGEELNNLTPKYLEELLFDDIPWLKLAKKEHQYFAQVFKDNGVKVYYLVDLVTEVLNYSNDIKNEFVEQFIIDSNIKSSCLKNALKSYLISIKDNKELVLKCISGIKKTDLKKYKSHSLSDFVMDDSPFVTYPIPNLYFTRDPFASVGDGVSISKMYSETRKRETIFAKFIFKYHEQFKNTTTYYNRDEDFNIEGGDILVLNKETLIIGVSQRTCPEAIEKLASNLNGKSNFKQILVFSIPVARTFMHLDTVFTQVDYDKFLVHRGCYNKLRIFEVKLDSNNTVSRLTGKPEDILAKYMGIKPKFIFCGGNDSISSDREQWSDGSNCVCIKPGLVIAYERNDYTNNQLRKNGIKIIEIPSSEISRGRGGPRCMSMPLIRKDLD